MAYAVPAVYADKTRLGEYAFRNQLGYQVNPYSVESISSLLTELSSNRGQLMNIHESLKKQREKETSWEDDFVILKKEIDAFFSR